MRLYGLIGKPLTHSFSEKYFTEKFKREGITDCAYQLFPLSVIGELQDLIKSHNDLCGLNVTIPYKKQVFPFLNELDIPFGLMACNCIKIEDGRLIGYNTDWTAFLDSINPLIKTNDKTALVLGSGGAADAVKFALEQLSIDVSIVSRELKAGTDYSYDQLDEQIMTNHRIIINTTPLGLYPNVDTCPPIPYEYVTPHHVLFDLVYNPSRTLFLKKGEKQGAAVKNGEEMLILQAEESWKIWNA